MANANQQIDMEHYRAILQKKQAELQDFLTKSEQDAREIPGADVGDEIDFVNSTEQKDLDFDEGNRSYEEMRQVQEALARIDAGTYGMCTICGRPIEKKRLDAIPWAEYCLEDAEAREPKIESPTL